MKNKNAFTLIELLVVISIIAILMAVMVPALKKARFAAKNVICQSNLKQNGVAINNYTPDYDGRLFPMYEVYNNKYYAPGTLSPTSTTINYKPQPWNTGRAYAMKWQIAKDRYKPFHLALLYENNYISEPEVFYCPHVTKYSTVRYEDFIDEGNKKWGTYFPVYRSSGTVANFVIYSYDYWIGDRTRIEQLNNEPLIFDEIHSYKLLRHRQGNDKPDGITALFSDGHVSYCKGPDVFNDEVWRGTNNDSVATANSPGNNVDIFENILAALQKYN